MHTVRQTLDEHLAAHQRHDDARARAAAELYAQLDAERVEQAEDGAERRDGWGWDG